MRAKVERLYDTPEAGCRPSSSSDGLPCSARAWKFNRYSVDFRPGRWSWEVIHNKDSNVVRLDDLGAITTAGSTTIYDKKLDKSVTLGHGTNDYTHSEGDNRPQKAELAMRSLVHTVAKEKHGW